MFSFQSWESHVQQTVASSVCRVQSAWLCLFGEWLLHVGLIHQPMWLISNNETNKNISKKEHEQYDSVACGKKCDR